MSMCSLGNLVNLTAGSQIPKYIWNLGSKAVQCLTIGGCITYLGKIYPDESILTAERNQAFWWLISLVVSFEDPSQGCQIDVVSNMFTALTCFHYIDWRRSHQPFLVFHTGCSIGPHRTRQTSVAWRCPPGFHPSSSCKGAAKSDSKRNTKLPNNKQQ